VHILSEEQIETSRQFARQADSRFGGVVWKPGPAGIPRLKGCSAAFECRTISKQQAGDHVLFIGRVEDFRYRPMKPLLFHGGRYHQLGHPL
jgi:flavin reductase (DIM6/NTAB) family NADH-FMN oxidoreductase RutF